MCDYLIADICTRVAQKCSRMTARMKMELLTGVEKLTCVVAAREKTFLFNAMCNWTKYRTCDLLLKMLFYVTILSGDIDKLPKKYQAVLHTMCERYVDVDPDVAVIHPQDTQTFLLRPLTDVGAWRESTYIYTLYTNTSYRHVCKLITPYC